MSLTKVTYSMINGAAVNIKDFGAVGDGITDDTAAIQAAINSGSKNIYAPAGSYKISSTITLSTTRDLTFKGAGRDATVFLTTVNDGTAAFSISGQWHNIGDFRVTSFSGALQNFIGIKCGSIATPTSFTRSKLQGVKVSYAAVGIECYGWVNDLDLFYTFCTLGFYGKELNSCVIDLRGEQNVTGFDMTNVYGTTFNNILEENTFSAGATTGTSLIRKGNAVTINSIYIESGTFSTTVIGFGSGSDYIQSLTINQIKSAAYPADKTAAVKIDRVQGVKIAGVVSGNDTTTRGALEFTSTASGIDPFVLSYMSSPTANSTTNYLQDNSRQIRKAENWFGDSFLYHGFNTFDVVGKTSVTVNRYTSLFITGNQSLRVIASTGAALCQVSLRRSVDNFPLLSSLVGKQIRMFAWVYVPSLAKFEDGTYVPAIQLAVGGGASASTAYQQTLRPNCWNLVETPTLTVPAGWTGTTGDYIDFNFMVNSSVNTVNDANYNILIDSIYLCKNDVQILDIQRGNWVDTPLLGVSTDGYNMQIRSNTYSSLNLPEYLQTEGDEVLYTSLSAGGFRGEVCVAGGTPGTWKTFSAITP